MTHSSIDLAAEAIEIAHSAPIYSDADYEAVMEVVEEAHANLRRVFVGGQTPGVPEDWRIDGLVFKKWDNLLDKAKQRAFARFNASKFFAAQRRADERRRQEKAAMTRHVDGWQNLQRTDPEFLKLTPTQQHEMMYKLALDMRHQGFRVRELKIGRETRWEYAQVNSTVVNGKKIFYKKERP